MEELRLGTRGSQLALWQANAVAAQITASGGPRCRIVVIRTSGDRLQQAPLSEVGGKRLFVKELEDALLGGDIDLAVHSSKDMPALLPDGLAIGGVMPRENPLDAVVLPQHVRLKPDTASDGGQSGRDRSRDHSGPERSPRDQSTRDGSHREDGMSDPGRMFDELDRLLATLGTAPAIGTGSVRRVAQLTRLFRNARFTAIRGNLDTRLRKLDNGEHDALILAAAGLRRLGFASRISLALPPAACLPAPGQGIVAIEVREDDDRSRGVAAAIDDPASGAALRAERALVAALGGGCQTPIGALASPVGDGQIELVAAVFALDGSREVRGRARGTRDEAEVIGARVGARLLADGADEILADARTRQSILASRESAAMTDD